MTATASRLGSAPITLDWSNLIHVPSHGSPQAAGPEALAGAWAQLRSRFSQGEIGFYDAPISDELSQAQESQRVAEAFLKRQLFTDCLFLGIGGSALGPIALASALQDRRKTDVRFHFIENPDSLEWKSTLKKLNPDTTLVCAVTKSGTTFETMAQLMLALEWSGPNHRKTHFLAITDPVRGDLRSFAEKEGIPTLSIAPSVGGRFSVFTPVGLFPLALAGLSVNDFLVGAKQVRDYTEKAPIEKNGLFILGRELIRHAQARPIHVCMPYSTRLKLSAAWFVQLWAESLGKDGKGFTPLSAVGATDQHSILQLLRDGPDDKVTFFITLDQLSASVEVPKMAGVAGSSVYPSFKLLEKHTLQELLTTEFRATSLVLTKRGRPSIHFHLDQLDEKAMGALLFAFATLTAFTGTLWGINPFDQPGVEEGKAYIREALLTASDSPSYSG